MYRELPSWLEECRIHAGNYSVGAFEMCSPVKGRLLLVVAANGDEWKQEKFPLPVFEHVSISAFFYIGKTRKTQCPLWEEMCFVKNLFWESEECVIQYHPPESKYVNCHPHTLHLWKPIGVEVPLPPKRCV